MLKRMLLITCIGLNVLSAQAYYTQHGNIYDEKGNEVTIQGVNWSGFQTETYFFHDLWDNSPSFNDMLNLMQSCTPHDKSGVPADSCFSVKTVRIPITPSTLARTQQSVTNLSIPGGTTFHFPAVSAQDWQTNYASLYNPADYQGKVNFNRAGNPEFASIDEPLNGLLYVIERFKQRGINVLLDFHNSIVSSRTGKIANGQYTAADWLRDVAFLSQMVKAANLTNVIGIDIYNEPHAMQWFNSNQDNNVNPASIDNFASWSQAVGMAALKIYQNNPELPVFVEGSSGPMPFYPNSNWGENFQPLAKQENGQVVFDPTKFPGVKAGNYIPATTAKTVNDWLWQHIVFSPHSYPASVATWQPKDQADANKKFEYNFGFLSKQFPVVIGEFGSFFKEKTDVDYMQWLAEFMQQHNMANKFFYWTWNENSGDTGGLLSAQGSYQLELVKETYLKNLANQKPPVVHQGTVSLQVTASDLRLMGQSVTLNLIGPSTTVVACNIGKSCDKKLLTGDYQVSAASLTEHDLTYIANIDPENVTITDNKTSAVTVNYQQQAPAILGEAAVTVTGDPLTNNQVSVTFNPQNNQGQAKTVDLSGQGLTTVTLQPGHYQLAAPMINDDGKQYQPTVTPDQIVITSGQRTAVALHYKASINPPPGQLACHLQLQQTGNTYYWQVKSELTVINAPAIINAADWRLQWTNPAAVTGSQVYYGEIAAGSNNSVTFIPASWQLLRNGKTDNPVFEFHQQLFSPQATNVLPYNVTLYVANQAYPCTVVNSSEQTPVLANNQPR